MRLIRIANHHDVIDLSPTFAIRPESRCPVHLGPHRQYRMLTHGQWAPHQNTFHNLGIFTDIHRTTLRVNYRTTYNSPLFDENGMFSIHLHATIQRDTLTSFRDQPEINLQFSGIQRKQMIRINNTGKHSRVFFTCKIGYRHRIKGCNVLFTHSHGDQTITL